MSVFRKLYRAYRPTWFQGPNVNTFYESICSLLDSIAQRFLDARMAAIPWAGPGVGVEEPLTSTGQRLECQPDALPYHSRDRGIPLYTTEGLLSRRQRLAMWRQLRAHRGTHWGAIEHIRPYFADKVAAGNTYPRITVVFQDNEGTPASVWYQWMIDGTKTITRVSPSNFDYDGQPTKRTRFWIFLEMNGTGYSAPVTYGSGRTYNDGALYGVGTFTAQAQADLVAMALDWHSAHSWLAGVVLIWPGYTTLNITGTPTQDADGRWSLPNGKWGSLIDPGTGKATRPAGWQWIYDSEG
jgi:hypothetical protein